MTAVVRHENGRWARPRAMLEVARGLIASLYHHRALALFSVLCAFVIWFVIQDVENPRVTRTFPATGPATIEVQAINANQLIPNDVYEVRVDIEGREGDLESLSSGDFEATIDVDGIPANTPTEVTVKVLSKRDGVKVLGVTPATIEVTLEPVVERELQVRLNTTGQLTNGFVVDDFQIEPPTVRVTGLEERLESIASVDLDVNLAALREGETVFEGELTARAANGNEVGAAISPKTGKVTYDVRQLFVQRTVPVDAVLVGQVAAGYRVTNITIEPPAIFVSGSADAMARLTRLVTEPIQLGNATGEIRRVQNIDAPELSLERRQVSVRIEVRPIECAAGAASACGAVGMQVAGVPADQPTGLVIVSPARLSVNVVLTGPLTVLDALTAGQITARISLAGGLAGPGSFPVTVVIPPNLLSLGIRAEQPPNMTITLGPGP